MDYYEKNHTCFNNKSVIDIVEIIKERDVWKGVNKENLECLICHLMLFNQDVNEFFGINQN